MIVNWRDGGNVNLTACVNAVRVRVQVQVSDHNGREHVVRVYRGECKFGCWYCSRGKIPLALAIEVKAKTGTGSSNAAACLCSIH